MTAHTKLSDISDRNGNPMKEGFYRYLAPLRSPRIEICYVIEGEEGPIARFFGNYENQIFKGMGLQPGFVDPYFLEPAEPHEYIRNLSQELTTFVDSQH